MKMHRGEMTAGIVLTGGALLVWLRDLSWVDSPANSLPLTLGLLLMWWIGAPWKRREDHHISPTLLVLVLVVFLSGWFFESLTFMALGWTGIAAVWIHGAFLPSPRQLPALLTGLLSFPWLLYEWTTVGSWFRYTATTAVGWFFDLLSLPVEREGSNLSVAGIPLEITEACAGWNFLQLSLLFGLAAAGWQLRGPPFMLILSLLIPLAWCANAFRIALITGLALSTDVEAASESLHTLTGLLVLLLTFACTRILCDLVGPNVRRQREAMAS